MTTHSKMFKYASLTHMNGRGDEKGREHKKGEKEDFRFDPMFLQHAAGAPKEIEGKRKKKKRKGKTCVRKHACFMNLLSLHTTKVERRRKGFAPLCNRFRLSAG